MLPGLLPPLANHLWQSTVFAVVAALLSMVLKKNQARTRYWIWLTASLKFLVPFSLLISAGSQFSWPTGPGAPAGPFVSAAVIGQVAQPFTSPQPAVIAPGAPAASPATPMAVLPVLALALWFVGCGAVLFRWWKRWLRVRAAVRHSSLLTGGREVEMLRRLEQTVGSRKPIAMISSLAAIEPSIFGLFRTVLIWPAGLSGRLADAELEAILLHELSHMRRRDNLAAALHMIVEAMFWFHPLVWWLGTRLVDEREKACDEDVLRWGGAAHAYAEGILKVCEFCLESPLVCAAGVTGSDLKKRIEMIMRNHLAQKLSPGRLLLLTAAAMFALAVPIAIGVVNATASRANSDSDQPANSIPTAELRPAADQGARVPAGLPAPEQPPAAAPEQAAGQVAASEPPPVPQAQASVQPPPEVQAPAPAPQTAPPAVPEAKEVFEMASVRPSSPPAGARSGGPGPRGGGRGGARGGGGGGACTGGPAQIDGNRFAVSNKNLYSLITMAYGLNCLNVSVSGVLSGGPAWIRSDQFEIQATMPEGSPTYTSQQFASGDAPKLQRMLQALLADSFKLTMHRETQEMPVYVLTQAAGGAKLAQSTEGVRRLAFGPVQIASTKASMADLVNMLTFLTNRAVQDRTGLAGEFDINVRFAPVDPTLPVISNSGPALPTLFTVLEELGLKLEAATAPVEIIVIDNAEKPDL